VARRPESKSIRRKPQPKTPPNAVRAHLGLEKYPEKERTRPINAVARHVREKGAKGTLRGAAYGVVGEDTARTFVRHVAPKIPGVGPLADVGFRAVGMDDRKPIDPKDLLLEGAMWVPGGRPVKAARVLRRGKKAKDVAKAADRPEGAEKVMEAVAASPKTRTAEEALRRPERAKRGAAAAKIASEVGGEAGYDAGKAALGGSYARLRFDKLLEHYGEPGSDLRAVLQPQVDGLFDKIRAAGLRDWEMRNTERALKKLLEGRSASRADGKLLGRVFGEEAERYLKHKRALDNLVRVANLPRSLRSTADLSLSFRQLLISGTRHPVLWKRSFGAQVKAARSPAAARAMLAEIAARPRAAEYDEAGLALTDLGGGIRTREEPFISDLAEKIPVGGHVVKAATRAFTVGSARFRADLYDLLADQAEAAGKYGLREKRGIASIINAGTGRGNMGTQTLERAAPFLTLGLFSPRLIASRIAFMNPYYYYKLPPIARKEALQSMVTLVGSGMAVLLLAKQMGATVGDDSRSADFGKIRIGDSRIDIWGGFQQYIVNASRIIQEESVSSSTNEVTKLTGGWGEPSRYTVATDFAVGKAAPIPGWVAGSWKGENFEGDDFSEVREGLKQFVPLGWESAYDTYKTTGDPAATAAMYALGFLGVGGQTYGSKPPKSGSSRRGGSGGSRSLRRRDGGGSKSLRRR
jgi:hypothetical protein